MIDPSMDPSNDDVCCFISRHDRRQESKPKSAIKLYDTVASVLHEKRRGMELNNQPCTVSTRWVQRNNFGADQLADQAGDGSSRRAVTLGRRIKLKQSQGVDGASSGNRRINSNDHITQSK